MVFCWAILLSYFVELCHIIVTRGATLATEEQVPRTPIRQSKHQKVSNMWNNFMLSALKARTDSAFGHKKKHETDAFNIKEGVRVILSIFACRHLRKITFLCERTVFVCIPGYDGILVYTGMPLYAHKYGIGTWATDEVGPTWRKSTGQTLQRVQKMLEGAESTSSLRCKSNERIEWAKRPIWLELLRPPFY